MTIRRHLYALAALITTCLTAQAGTVSWGSEAIERLFADSQGDYLAFGSLALLGTFDPSTDFATYATDYDYLSGKFTLFGEAKIGDGGFYDPNGDPAQWIYGGFGAVADVNSLDTQLFYWLFNAPTAVAATEWGIFTNISGLWTTPASLPESMQTDIVQGDFAHVGELTETLALTAFARNVSVPDASSTGALLLFALALCTATERRKNRR